MFVNRLTLCLCTCALLMLARSEAARAQDVAIAAARADHIQSLSSIRAAAEQAVRGVIDTGVSGVTLTTTSLDPRLRLVACATRLDTFANTPRGSQSRVAVRVSCAQPAWTLNVPVEIRRLQKVLVLQRAVGRGEGLQPADVQVQTRELPGLGSPFVSSVDQLAGRLTRRPLPEGTALTADALSIALLIKRGQQVTLVAQSSGFEVRAPGRAMADAGADQRVRVQNLNSLKVIEGVADKDGTVRVSP
jgi:flagellar basal body P-ring formation protein FlgA